MIDDKEFDSVAQNAHMLGGHSQPSVHLDFGVFRPCLWDPL